MVEEELAKANAKMYSKEMERLQMAVKDTKENADAIIIEQQEEIEKLQDMDKILRNENINLKLRINKAIEYINVCKINDMGIRYQRIEEILQGSGK